VRHADLILVVSSGRIVERGDHDALIRRQGIYARIHERQQLEAELEQ